MTYVGHSCLSNEVMISKYYRTREVYYGSLKNPLSSPSDIEGCLKAVCEGCQVGLGLVEQHSSVFTGHFLQVWHISKNDLWLTLLTRLILLPAPLKPSQYWFRALSHLARYACYFPHPNSPNLVTLVHLRLPSTGTHKLICMSGIWFPCVIETRPGGALRKLVSLLKVVC